MGPRDDSAAGFDALVSGKRNMPRLPVELSVRIKCARRVFDATARDLSVAGARVELDPALLVDESGAEMDAAAQLAFMERHFGDSFDIEFPEQLVVVEARLRRLALGSDRLETLGLGCQFVHALGESQQRALGILSEGQSGNASWDAAVSRHALHLEADPRRPVTAMLLDDQAVVSGPLFLGPVAAVGRRAVVVRLEGIQSAEASDVLSHCDLRVRLLRGADSLLDTFAEFVSARYMDSARPGCDVLLSLRTRLPRSVRRSFRRAA